MREEVEIEQDCGNRHRDVQDELLPPYLRHRFAHAPRQIDMRAADAALVGKIQDALGARVERPMHGMPEARRLSARFTDFTSQLQDDLVGIPALGHPGTRL